MKIRSSFVNITYFMLAWYQNRWTVGQGRYQLAYHSTICSCIWIRRWREKQ